MEEQLKNECSQMPHPVSFNYDSATYPPLNFFETIPHTGYVSIHYAVVLNMTLLLTFCKSNQFA
jgi:hypothetical protein